MNDKKNREPMVIALATGKGGSMKTTSAVFLACALVDQSRGEQHVLVVDADVQGDAKDWWYRADELGDPLPFDVMSAAPADITHLRGINDRLDDPVDWVLIDSAPYGRALDESVNNADLVVIPSSPSRIDLDQAVGVKNLCDRRGVPSAILLIRVSLFPSHCRPLNRRIGDSYAAKRGWFVLPATFSRFFVLTAMAAIGIYRNADIPKCYIRV